MQKINVWFTGKKDNYSDYLIRKINNADDLELTRAFFSKSELKNALKTGDPDILILDLPENKSRALSDISSVYKINEGVKIILLINQEDEQFIVKAICRGAYDYLIRNLKVQDINSKIKEVYQSKTPLNAVLKNNFKRTFETVNYTAMVYDLSAREKEILGLMVGGLTKKKMAETLSISFHTIDSHLRRIYSKLGVNTKIQAVSKALKEQLVTA